MFTILSLVLLTRLEPEKESVGIASAALVIYGVLACVIYDMEHTPRIINTAYHDMLTEEIWDIQKTVTGTINFKNLARLGQRKAAVIYHAILGNMPSVAFKPEL